MSQEETRDITNYRNLDPRQQYFIEFYINVDSPTFANCYQSAIKAGYSEQTARNITHNKPRWYSELLGQHKIMEPEHLVAKLASIINNPEEKTHNKLRAIDMLMKHHNMYIGTHFQNNVQVNIQSVLN